MKELSLIYELFCVLFHLPIFILDYVFAVTCSQELCVHLFREGEQLLGDPFAE